MVGQSRKWWQLTLLDEQVSKRKASGMRAEETFDPTENGGRVLLNNPDNCKKTNQKRIGLL